MRTSEAGASNDLRGILRCRLADDDGGLGNSFLFSSRAQALTFGVGVQSVFPSRPKKKRGTSFAGEPDLARLRDFKRRKGENFCVSSSNLD